MLEIIEETGDTRARFARSSLRDVVLSCLRAVVRAPRARKRKKEFVLNLEFEIWNLFGIWNFEF